ncbi:MAG: hypothetical protein WBD58_08745 [Geitlerinemataceae cyanobacterium]
MKALILAKKTMFAMLLASVVLPNGLGCDRASRVPQYDSIRGSVSSSFE